MIHFHNHLKTKYKAKISRKIQNFFLRIIEKHAALAARDNQWILVAAVAKLYCDEMLIFE